MKDEILNSVSMKDIIEKYNISHIRRKMRCPFHGHDKHPSAQIYDNYFHCFTCGKHLDSIGFVEEYFNLNFKEAMQKINEDFYLGLKSNTKIDYKKIREIEKEKKLNIKLYNSLEKKFLELCNTKFKYLKRIDYINAMILINNWEEKTEEIALLQTKIELIDIQLDYLIDEMYEFKKTRF